MSVSEPNSGLQPPHPARTLHSSSAIFDLLQKREEDEQLTAEIQEREQKSKSLQKRIEELQKESQKAQDLHSSFDMFLKEEDIEKMVKKAERERREVLQKNMHIEALQEERMDLMQRKQDLEQQLQRLSVYWEVLERTMPMTKFKDAESLADNLESQLHLRGQLCQRERAAEERVEQQRKALAALDNQHDLIQLQRSNQLSQLQSELEETRSEALIWERKWSHIQETAAKKTLLLGQIKMATLNLFEMTGGLVEDDVDMNDTEKQLDKIRIFIQDHDDILKRHQSSSQTQPRAERRQCVP